VTKLLAHLVARAGCREALLEALGAVAEGWSAQQGLAATVLAARSYQYCMRRLPGWSHADSIVRYAEGHSPLGVRTQGKAGYTQFHVDPEATARASVAAGFGVREVDSVAELQLESLEAFLAAGRANAELGAAEDEEQFVDRAASVMWVSDVIARYEPARLPARRDSR